MFAGAAPAVGGLGAFAMPALPGGNLNFAMAPAPQAQEHLSGAAQEIMNETMAIQGAYAPFYHGNPRVYDNCSECDKAANAGKNRKGPQADIKKHTHKPLINPPGSTQMIPNEDCRFKADFFNPKPKLGNGGNAVARRPQDWPAVRAHIEDGNPDPEKLVGYSVVGIDELLIRFNELCEGLAYDIDQGVEMLRSVIQNCSQKQYEQKNRFEKQQERQARLEERMLNFLSKVEKYSSRERAVEFEEYKFREKAEELMHEVRQRHLQLTELINLQAQHDLVRDEYVDNLSPADLDVIYAAMAKQHEGLQHVMDVLDRDTRHVEIMRHKLEQRGQEIQGFGFGR